MTPNRETIYIDVEDDITGIIDKISNAKSGQVSLVLPKRASVLQSVVNMKLLKKSSGEAGKTPVLITSESTLLPIAGSVGVHVAPNLRSKPEIPLPPKSDKPPASESASKPDQDVSVNEPTDQPQDELSEDQSAADDKPKRSGKPKVPNFKRFRKRIFLIAGAGLLLIVFLVWAIFFAPKATVLIRTETSDLEESIEFIAREDSVKLNLEDLSIPAVKKEVSRSGEKRVPATGQEDRGSKARGSVSMTAGPCTGNQPSPVSSGTGISTSGLTYIMRSNASFSPVVSNGQCEWRSGSTNVVAQKNGRQYNIGPSTFTVSGHSGVTAVSGQSMSGGKTNIVKIVSANDINNAEKEIIEEQGDATSELQQELEGEGLFALEGTFEKGSPNTVASPRAGTQANQTTVTVSTTQSMLGVKENDLKKIIDRVVKDKENINAKNQAVINYGLQEGEFRVEGARDGGIAITLDAKLVIGPKFDEDQLKESIFGMKEAQAETELDKHPGFSDTRVETSPFWVSSIPGKLDRISIIIEEPDEPN